MTPLELLKAARAVMASHQLHKGQYFVNDAGNSIAESQLSELGISYDEVAGCCGFGAIIFARRQVDSNAYFEDELNMKACQALLAACGMRRANAGYEISNFACWNDRPERTKDEVLAVFDKAIQAETERTAVDVHAEYDAKFEVPNAKDN